VDGDGDSDIADLRNLRESDAVRVFKLFYADKVQADLLPIGLDYAMTDFAVNSGPSRAAKHLQRILGVEQDGDIGPKTLAKVTTWAVIPDVINAGTQEQDALLREWPHGQRGAPVWYMDEPINRLLRLCDEWPRICIGSTDKYAAVLSPAWRRKMDEAFNEISARNATIRNALPICIRRQHRHCPKPSSSPQISR